MKYILLVSFILHGFLISTAQTVELDQPIKLSAKSMTIEEALKEIKDNLEVEFSFVTNDIDHKKGISTLDYATLEEHLLQILGDDFEFKIKGSKILIRKKSQTQKEAYIVNGYVRDSQTGEELIGASISNSAGNYGAISNVYGFYSLRLSSEEQMIRCSYLGYQNLEVKLNLQSDSVINFNLDPQELVLSEIVVNADRQPSNVESLQMSANTLSAKQIEEIPAFLGEVDVIKSITLLPGVTTVGEGSPGFNVRGGDVDQNLILLDEAPVYSSAHLLGFFSVFNADVIKDVKLYKGGIPSKYGGRVSSVLDVRQKEGDMKAFHGKGGIGIVSSRLTLEAPIVKDKSSFIIAGRRTYADLIYRTVRPSNDNSAVYFYDLNTKINYRFNDKNRLYLSGYFGNDVARLGNDVGFKWGNSTGTLRWNYVLNPSLFLNTSLIYSRYNYQLNVDDSPEKITWESSINNYHFKPELTWFLNAQNTLDMGAQVSLFEFQPGEVTVSGDINASFKVQKEKALELGVYLGNEQKIGDNLTLRYGLRYSRYHFLGSLDVYTYDPTLPRREENIIDSASYNNNETIKSFDGWEPRFSAAYQFNANNSIKASYQRMYQYQQLVSNTTNVTPFDVWKSAGPYIPPLTSQQFAFGYFKSLRDNTFEISAEVYYKTMNDLIDYKNGADLILTENIETELLTGNGRAYGLELFFEKKLGRLNGWLAYTLSRTERQVKGDIPINSINNGEYYPSDYDKTHDVSLVMNYKVTPRWTVNMNFLYATGRPATYPDGRYEFEGAVIPNYSSRNNERLPDYHRIDLSATLKNRTKPGKKWSSSWTFSVYNVYARKNAFSIFFRPDEDSNNAFSTKATQLSILGSVFPAISYNFEF